MKRIVHLLRKLIPVFITFNFFVLTHQAQTTDNLNKPKYLLASGAFGFLSAQNESLTFIEKQFPTMQLDVFKARLSFDIALGKAEEEISVYLEDFMGTSNFKNFKDSIKKFNLEVNQSSDITINTAKEFLSLVEKRANGQIPTPYLETLCAFHFKDSPEEEFIFGFTRTFDTKDHSKAKNTDWSIRIPLSWKEEEGTHPNVIKKFISDLGHGGEMVILMVRDLDIPNIENLTKEEIESFYTEENFRGIIPKDATFISFTKSKLDNITAGIIEYDNVSNSAEFPIKVRMLQYSFIYKNQIYMIQCFVSSNDITEDLSGKMAQFKFLFKSIANSVVVNEQYK